MIKYLFPALFLLLTSCQRGTTDADSFEVQLQDKISHSREGDVIELPEGTFEVHNTLVLKGVNNLTIKGKGMGKTILSFKQQNNGPGWSVTADGATLEDFSIRDTKEDGIKIQNSRGVVMSHIDVGWNKPVGQTGINSDFRVINCTRYSMNECEAFGAGVAGVRVEQSRTFIIRHNHMQNNTAGVLVEKSSDGDIIDNSIEKNTVGIFASNLPGVTGSNTSLCRIFNNRINNNNTANQASGENLLPEISPGTGILLLASSHCEINNNFIGENNAVQIAVLSYSVIQKPTPPAPYETFCWGVNITGNRLGGNHNGTADKNTLFGKILSASFGNKIPDIVIDGAYNPAHLNSDGSIKADRKVCIHNNADATFGNMDLPGHGAKRSNDAQKFDCTLPGLNEVKLN